MKIVKSSIGKNKAGVFGFFAIDEKNNEFCFYIGKSIDMKIRTEDICMNRGHYVYHRIIQYIEQGYRIEIRPLVEIDFFEDKIENVDNDLYEINIEYIFRDKSNDIVVNMKSEDKHWLRY